MSVHSDLSPQSAILSPVTRLLLAITRRWWAVVLVFALNFASFAILFALEDQFEAITQTPVYDTQNDLTSDQILAQLPLYTGEAREAYFRFAAFDFIFPLVAGIFLVVLWTLLLRFNTWGGKLLAWNLPLFPLLATLWDWLENIGMLMILNTGADPTWIEAALLFKRLKLVMLSATGGITIALHIFLAINLIYRFTRRVMPSPAIAK